jgi:hypothetical protein
LQLLQIRGCDIVVGEGQHADAGGCGLLQQILGGQFAVGALGVGVQVNVGACGIGHG